MRLSEAIISIEIQQRGKVSVYSIALHMWVTTFASGRIILNELGKLICEVAIISIHCS